MQRIILHKHVPTAEKHLLDIYYRLYFKVLLKYLRSKNLFLFTDYLYSVASLDRQLVSIDITFITPEAQNAIPDFNALHLNLAEKELQIALEDTSITVGKKLEANISELKIELEKLHEISWIDFYALPLIQASSTKAATNLISDTGEDIKPFKCVFGIRTNEPFMSEHSFSPLLFSLISHSLSYELFQRLNLEYSCNLKQTEIIYENNTAYHLNTLFLYGKHTRQEICSSIIDILNVMNGEAFTKSVINYIRTDFQNSPEVSIEYRKLYRLANVIGGVDAWRNFTTQENIEELLNNTLLGVNDLAGEVSVQGTIGPYLLHGS